jgi:general secretion pathway protein G
MKRTNLIPFALALVLAGLLATLNTGCGKKPASPAGGGNAPSPVASVEKTSFSEVTSQLDPGGDFYLYLGTAQWLDGLSAKVGAWRQTFTAMPGLKPEDAANVNKAFDIATRLIKDSGIEDVSGVGMSSVEIEKGMYRNKALLYHYPGKGAGFLWQLAGKEPHPLTGLDFLPQDAAFAMFSDADLPVLWTVAKKEIAQADLPQAQRLLDQFPAQFEKNTHVKWDAFLKSLGGEFGLVVTLDPSATLPVPLPGASLEIPTPGLLLAVKVNDDTIFNRIDQQLKANGQVIRVDRSGLKMRTMRVPVPFIGELRPSAASSVGYLLIASSDALIDDALAVKSGRTPGLKSTDEFKHLAQGIPGRGNQFVFVSQRFAETMMKVQQQAMAASAKSEPAMAQWLQSIYRNRPAFAYSVGMNTPEGCLTVGNSSQSYANVALLAPAFTVGMLSAIAIPNFVKARATSQENACINNLRAIQAAKNEWALEKGKTATDVPTKEDLLPYLHRWPVCPAGGTYTINAVGQNPTCSIPGHVLP